MSEDVAIDINEELLNLSSTLAENPAHLSIIFDKLAFDQNALSLIDGILNEHSKLVYRNLVSHSPLHTLALLKSMIEWNNGFACARVYQAFEWHNKVFTKMLQAATQQGNIRQKKSRIAVSKKRSAFIQVLISLLRYLTAEAKMELMKTHSLVTPLLKGVTNDEAVIVKQLLQCFLTHIVDDSSVSRSAKVSFFNEWVLGTMLPLYSRMETLGEKTLREYVHEFYERLCTIPNQGICFESVGWHSPAKTETSNSSVYNRVLLAFLPQLHVLTDPLQQDLCLKVLSVCPDITYAYLQRMNFPGDSVLTFQFISYMGFLQSILALPIPSPFLSPSSRKPANMNVIVENIAPNGFPKPSVLRCLNGGNELSSFLTCNILIAILKRFKNVLFIAKKEIESHTELLKLKSTLSDAVLRRLPDAQSLFQTFFSAKTLLLKEALSELLCMYFDLLPEGIMKLKVDGTMVLDTSVSGDMLTNKFVYNNTQNGIKLLSKLPQVRWWEANDSIFSYLCSLYLGTDSLQMRQTISATISVIFSDYPLFSEALYVDNTLLILDSLERLPIDARSDSISFLNDCIQRCTSKIYRQLDTCVAVFNTVRKTSDPTSIPKLSPLTCVIIEQLGYKLANQNWTKEAKEYVLNWTFNFLQDVVIVGESCECILHLLSSLETNLAQGENKFLNRLQSLGRQLTALSEKRLFDTQMPESNSLSGQLLQLDENELCSFLSSNAVDEAYLNELHYLILEMRVSVSIKQKSPVSSVLIELLLRVFRVLLKRPSTKSQNAIKSLGLTSVYLSDYVLVSDEVSFYYSKILKELVLVPETYYVTDLAIKQVYTFLSCPFNDVSSSTLSLLCTMMNVCSEDVIIELHDTVEKHVLSEHFLEDCPITAGILSQYFLRLVSVQNVTYGASVIATLIKASLLLNTVLIDAVTALFPHFSEVDEVASMLVPLAAEFIREDMTDKQIGILIKLSGLSEQFRMALWNGIIQLPDDFRKTNLLKHHLLYSGLLEQPVRDQTIVEGINTWSLEVVRTLFEQLPTDKRIMSVLPSFLSNAKNSNFNGTEFYKIVRDCLCSETLTQSTLKVLILLQRKEPDLDAELLKSTYNELLQLFTRFFSENGYLSDTDIETVRGFLEYLNLNQAALINKTLVSTLNSFLEASLKHLAREEVANVFLTVVYMNEGVPFEASKFLAIILASEENPLLFDTSTKKHKALVAAIISKLVLTSHASSFSMMNQIMLLCQGRYTLHDSMLLSTLRWMEEQSRISVASCFNGWTATDEVEIIKICRKDKQAIFEPMVAKQTLDEFPSGFSVLHIDDLQGEKTVDALLLSEDYLWNERVYHPVYALSLLAYILQNSNQASTIQTLVSNNILGIAIMLLAVYDIQYRDLSLNLLRHVYITLEDMKMYEKPQLKLVLSSLLFNYQESGERMTTLMSAFYANSLGHYDATFAFAVRGCEQILFTAPAN
ncbi:ribosome biogenesis protein Urb1 [Schizosaccharomyces japonicus yFS275]|uniref:Ribosome biogenesis protein Urb1 n=1 Tax=Schizosaccharomyces japonicus (strain yFS275 / FY16936) TaxID=402676 RepID=B6K6F8_SCHJY|nr:ribosome biogenesis protein Urb1 [Schizosaccharomyces japonicus yFS275]EEB09112.2 ribosome biogenesis protein Urb1 [Schizosaccharomyces japonicus yFS275]